MTDLNVVMGKELILPGFLGCDVLRVGPPCGEVFHRRELNDRDKLPIVRAKVLVGEEPGHFRCQLIHTGSEPGEFLIIAGPDPGAEDGYNLVGFHRAEANT